MKPFLAALILLALAGCVRNPTPVTAENTTVAAEERLAIAVEYVAVPSLTVYARPDTSSETIGTYGMKEAISVLAKQGEWAEIRTFGGVGWVRQSDLLAGELVDKIDTTVPRFYVEPSSIPFSARGEIWMQARVNTDGSVIDVQTTKNTTGFAALANANADALKAAKFYPLLDKGTRKSFIYEHRVYY